MTLIERDQDEARDLAPGQSVVLTPDGWEAAEYLEPGDDWTAQEDGSFVSPDGLIRTWPLAGAGPD